MLKQVFTSQSVPGGVPNFLTGLFSLPFPPTNDGTNDVINSMSPDTLFLAVQSGGLTYYGFDAQNGIFLSNETVTLSVFAEGVTIILSALGNLYVFLGGNGILGSGLIPIAITVNTDGSINYSLASVDRFGFGFQNGGIPASKFGLFNFNHCSLDDENEILIDGPSDTLNTYNTATGALLKTLYMPDAIVATCLYQDNIVFVLCANRMLVSVNYVNGVVLGAVKVPPAQSTHDGNFTETQVGNSILIYFYPTLSQLMVVELLSPMVIRGYLVSPVATRLTTPIPLLSPLLGQNVPVLTQIVDDSNFGIGGGLINPLISGATLAGQSTTDYKGNAQILVYCSGDGEASVSATVSIPDVSGDGQMTVLTNSATINITPVASPATISASLPVLPAVPYSSGKAQGRIVHPTLGVFDYEYKPDEWVNIDGDVIIAPTWSSSKSLQGSSHSLWLGDISDVVCEERWLASGGMAMPISQLRMLISIWCNPVDPTVGYVQWFPNYVNDIGYNVLPVDLVVGTAGQSSLARLSGIGYQVIALDDVVNSLQPDGETNNGWVDKPVTFFLKIVGYVNG